MTAANSERQADEPILERDSYRIWDGKGLTAKERAEAEKVSCNVRPGERIHEIVVFELGGGCTLKALSKQRDKDGRVNVLFWIEEPSGRIGVLRSDEWVGRSDYDRVIGALKSMAGEDSVTAIRGEDIHVGLADALTRTGDKERARDRGERERGAGPDAPPAGKQGGEEHGR